MSLTYGFYNSVNNDRRYDARQMAAIFDGVINDGVFMSIGDALMVKVISGMTVSVGKGRAWFNSTWTLNDTLLPLTLSPAELILPRIDAIVLEVNANLAVRENSIKIIKGTPASSPANPALIKSEFVNQYPLCYIRVNQGVNTLTQADITNMVGTSSCPFVTGILETMSTDAILAQWESEFDNWMIASNNDFNTWKTQQSNAFTTWRNQATTDFDNWQTAEKGEFDSWKNTQKTEYSSWRAQETADMTTWKNKSKSDYDTWFAQFKAWQTQEEAAFDAWFNDLVATLDGDVAGNLLNKINENKAAIATKQGYEDIRTETGAFISVDNADNGSAKINMKGKSTQVNTNAGKNKFDINSKKVTKSSDISSVVIDGKTITFISGNTVAYSSIGYILDHDLYKGKTFTFSCELNSSTDLSLKSTGMVDYMEGGVTKYAGFNKDTSAKITFSEDLTYLRIRLISNNLPTSSNVESTTVFAGIQAEEGSNKTTYEGFVPNSPSPEYPSSIVSDVNFDLVSCGDNICPKFASREYQGIIISVDDYGVVTLNGTSTALVTIQIPSKVKKIFKDVSYTFSTSNPVAHSEIHFRLLRVAGGGILDNNNMNMILDTVNATKTIVSKTEEDIGYIGIRIGQGVTLTDFKLSPKIEIGSVATPYTPYKEDRITIPLNMGEWNEIKDGQHIKGGETAVLDGSPDEVWLLNEGFTKENTLAFHTTLPNSLFANFVNCLCDKFKVNVDLSTSDFECFRSANVSGAFYIRILKSRLSSLDVNGFKTWLQSNPVTFRYQLATPVITPLNTYLKTFKGKTNISTTSVNRLEMTATFKTELWTKDYLLNQKDLELTQKNADQDLAIEAKINKTDIVNNDQTGGTDKVASAEVVKVLGAEIDATKRVLTATLTTTWSGSSAPYTQSVNVAGIKPTDIPVIDIVLSSDAAIARQQLREWAKVDRIVTWTDKITVQCLNNKPTIDLPIQIKGV